MFELKIKFDSKDELADFVSRLGYNQNIPQMTPGEKMDTQAPTETAATAATAATEPTKKKRGRPRKDAAVEPQTAVGGEEDLSPRQQKMALKKAIESIKDFIMEDKATNTQKVLPLMPQGKNNIGLLTLEEAQEIALELGLS